MQAKFLNVFQDAVGQVGKSDPLLWVISRAIEENTYDTRFHLYLGDLKMLVKQSRSGDFSPYSIQHLYPYLRIGFLNDHTVSIELSDSIKKKILSNPASKGGKRLGQSWFEVKEPTSQALILFLQGLILGKGSITNGWVGLFDEEEDIYDPSLVTRLMRKVEPQWPQD